ncbi:MAG: hypothetical protein FH749_05515 [Firmicutes bacterium]|nr:hypothetical protein [Bacillota bacterium]
MSRGRRRTSVIIGLAFVMILLVYSVVTIQGTGAWFSTVETDTSDVTVLEWKAEIENYEELITVTDLIPGRQSESKEVTIKNSGEVEFIYWVEIARPDTQDSNILWGDESELYLVIQDDDGADIYKDNLIDGEIVVGQDQLDPNDDVTLSFYVHLSQAADNQYSAQSTQVEITFHAYQVDAIDDEGNILEPSED